MSPRVHLYLSPRAQWICQGNVNMNNIFNKHDDTSLNANMLITVFTMFTCAIAYVVTFIYLVKCFALNDHILMIQ